MITTEQLVEHILEEAVAGGVEIQSPSDVATFIVNFINPQQALLDTVEASIAEKELANKVTQINTLKERLVTLGEKDAYLDKIVITNPR